MLNLVTTDSARFYRQQVETLEDMGMSCATLPVPGSRNGAQNRSPVDYLRFFPTVVRQALGPYDLVHANFGLTAPHALAQVRLPVVVSLWGTDLFGRYGWVSDVCTAYADEVIVMSQDMADALDCDCHVIPHGVDFEKFRPRDRAAARRDVGWDLDERHVLFPYYTDRPVKNYPLAKRVTERARERLDRPLTLQTVTDVPHDRMPTYMNAADCLLLTSRWEGSPNAVKEALACNLPVVSRPVGDVPERLEGVSPSGIGTTEADLVDTLVSVLKADERSNGREETEELSLTRMGERIAEVYEEAT